MIKINTFHGYTNTLDVIIAHLRDAVSHPTDVNLAVITPSTGFKTINNSHGLIEKVAFVHSPDTRYNKPFWSRGYLCRAYDQPGFPDNAKIYNGQICIPDNEGKMQPCTRIFRMDIPVPKLVQFVQKLSDEIINNAR